MDNTAKHLETLTINLTLVSNRLKKAIETLEYYSDCDTYLKDHTSGAKEARYRVLRLDDLEQMDGFLMGGKLAREILKQIDLE